MVRIPRRGGYTLVEVMLVVAILGIIASVGANMLLQVNRYFILSQARLDVQKEARAAMYVMTRELRQAQSNTIIIDQAPSQPYYSRITFEVNTTTMTFEQQGNELIQSVKGGQIVLSKNLEYLAFTFPRSDDITILSVSVTLKKEIYQGRSKAIHMASEQVQVMN